MLELNERHKNAVGGGKQYHKLRSSRTITLNHSQNAARSKTGLSHTNTHISVKICRKKTESSGEPLQKREDVKLPSPDVECMNAR
jgi:hypothetical protein